jgi:hypothetical protein
MNTLSHPKILAMMEHVAKVRFDDLHKPPRLRFSTDNHIPNYASEDRRPCVYAWVIDAKTDSPQIIYLGKGGRGLVARLREHEQGFRNKDGKGKSNGDKLFTLLENQQVDVFAMWPEAALFRGIEIPSHSAVEDWLLGAIDRPPALNREAAALARAEAIAAGTHVPKPRKRNPKP